VRWRGSSAWWLCAVVLVALNLRTSIASVPPVADAISADLGLNATGTGLLTTLPVVCMGLFAPVAVLASRRVGRGFVLAPAVGLIASGTGLRAIPDAVPLFAGTVLAGIGIAVAGALLPPLVRERFAGRVGPVTGLYTAGLIGGAMLAAALTEPIRLRVGGAWSTALAVWALPALLAVVAWLTVAGPRSTAAVATAAPEPRAGHPWRDRVTWWATLFMGGQSLLYYGALAWLAARYTAIGFDAAEAGLLLGVFSATQLVSALGLPALVHRTGALPAGVAVSVGTTTAMLAAIAVVPAAAPWVWAALLGLGAGGMFALALTVLGSLGRNPAEAAAASSLAFFVGYLLASLGPVTAGALRDLTGGYRAPFLALAAVGVGILVAGLAAARAVVRPRASGL
jgi:MFS transporter, CP family, cyanate transporter